MRQRQHKFTTLVSMVIVLWSLCQGCPNVPGPTCAEELPNAIPTINRLKKSVKDLLRTYVEEGYGFRDFTGPVCILGNNGIRDQPADLDAISTTLCQYAKCFQHFADNLREISLLPLSITREIFYCQSSLKRLEKVIEKMKQQPSSLCTTVCRVSWSAESAWDEIIKGSHLAQELLAYLEQFNFLPAEAAKSICST